MWWHLIICIQCRMDCYSSCQYCRYQFPVEWERVSNVMRWWSMTTSATRMAPAGEATYQFRIACSLKTIIDIACNVMSRRERRIRMKTAPPYKSIIMVDHPGSLRARSESWSSTFHFWAFGRLSFSCAAELMMPTENNGVVVFVLTFESHSYKNHN